MRALSITIYITMLLFWATLAQAQSMSLETVPTTQDRISVIVEGSGPDVILIPGLASSYEVWRSLAGRLRQSHRLHLVQIAGFAGSPAFVKPDGQVAAPTAKAIANYILHENIKAPIIIGHSLGGEIALMLGARYPTLVKQLIIVDALPFYSLLLDSAATSEAVKPYAMTFRNTMMEASTAEIEAMQTASIARLAKTEAIRPVLVEASVRSDRETVANATYELMTIDLRPELKRITVPVKVIYAYDPLYGISSANIDERFRNAYATTPNVSFKRIDESFHFIMFDQPEIFEQVVIDFLGLEVS